MNHDITHCKGDDYPKKDTCYRYVAWLDFPRYHKETGSILITMISSSSCIENNYNLYWRNKK